MHQECNDNKRLEAEIIIDDKLRPVPAMACSCGMKYVMPSDGSAIDSWFLDGRASILTPQQVTDILYQRFVCRYCKVAAPQITEMPVDNQS